MKNMQEKENINLVAKALDTVLNEHDLNAIDLYWTENYIQHNQMVKNGKEPFREFIKGWLNAMPDLKWEPILQPVAFENQVWAYGKYTGTFKKDWMGLKANNKTISFTAVDIVQVKNAKIAEHWDVMDLKTMFEQMGVK
jgi:predicted SnoaL-like aldol condensation-catalyzing enzyme